MSRARIEEILHDLSREMGAIYEIEGPIESAASQILAMFACEGFQCDKAATHHLCDGCLEEKENEDL